MSRTGKGKASPETRLESQVGAFGKAQLEPSIGTLGGGTVAARHWHRQGQGRHFAQIPQPRPRVGSTVNKNRPSWLKARQASQEDKWRRVGPLGLPLLASRGGEVVGRDREPGGVRPGWKPPR